MALFEKSTPGDGQIEVDCSKDQLNYPELIIFCCFRICASHMGLRSVLIVSDQTDLPGKKITFLFFFTKRPF